MNRYHINIFWSDTDRCWITDVPDLRTCSAFGDTREEALAEVEKVMAVWLEVAREEGHPIPTATYRQAIYSSRGTGSFHIARSAMSSLFALPKDRKASNTHSAIVTACEEAKQRA